MARDELVGRKKFGELLKSYRANAVVEGKRVSQGRLANLVSYQGDGIELDRSYISNWENGIPDRRLPRPDELEAIVLVLELTEHQRDNLLEALRGAVLESAGYEGHSTSDTAPDILGGIEGIRTEIERLAEANTLLLDADKAKRRDTDASPYLKLNIDYWVGRPASIALDFIGREDELDFLANAFTEHRAVVISGGVGYGKSRLAVEYAHQSGTRGFWTIAGKDVTQTLAHLAQSSGVYVKDQSDTENAKLIQSKLSTFPSDTLWCVDGLEDLDLVNDLLNATDSLRLLITTRDDRRQVLPATVGFLPMHVLDVEEAIELVCSRSSTDPQDAVLWELAKEVGYLPMALEMLAVRLGSSFQSPEALLAEIRTAPNPLQIAVFQEISGATLNRVHGVFAALSGALGSLPTEVREQLFPLGYVADAPLPKAFLSTITDLEDQELSRMVEECRRQSIMSLVNDQPVLHSLTIAAISATNSQDAMLSTFERARLRLLRINWRDPQALSIELAHYEQLFTQAQRATGVRDSWTFFEYAHSLVLSYGVLGDHEVAVRLGEQTLAEMEQTLGSDDDSILKHRDTLAQSYAALGRRNEAFRLAKRNLATCEKLHGSDDLFTHMYASNLANHYADLGYHDEAFRITKRAAEGTERVLGSDHVAALGAYAQLANRYSDLGRHIEAIKLMERTAPALERLVGPSNPAALTLRSRLADEYCTVGREQEALPIYQQVLTSRENMLGSEHPDTVHSRSQLVDCEQAVNGARKKQVKVAQKQPKVETMAKLGKIGRNSPCPCGSGRKYKRCCGR